MSLFPIDNLPKKTFNVLPFMKGLTRWMAIHGMKRKKKNRSGSNKKGGDRPSSKQKQRVESTKKDREAFNDNETGWSEAEVRVCEKRSDKLRRRECWMTDDVDRRYLPS